jgi:predicted secreted protein
MEKIFTRTEQGSSVSVRINEPFVLELDETPVTGYQWHIMANAGIEIISSDISLHAATAGSGGIRRFVMKATDPGSFHLVARLRRVWEEENIFIDAFDMHLQVANNI